MRDGLRIGVIANQYKWYPILSNTNRASASRIRITMAGTRLRVSAPGFALNLKNWQHMLEGNSNLSIMNF
jgi:hypothetical protein